MTLEPEPFSSHGATSVAYARSPIDIPWRGTPGPVWTMAAGTLVYAALALMATFLRDDEARGSTVLIATAGYSLLVAVVLMVLRARTPMWLLQAQCVVVIAFTAVLVQLAPTPVNAVNISFRYVAIVLYVSYWMSWRVTAVATALVTVSSYVSYWLRDDDFRVLFPTWLIVTLLCWLLASIVNHLTRVTARHATVDPLTGMLNRGGLAMLLDAAREPGRHDISRTLVVIDLDDFKRLNDTHGHLAGDEALRQLGEAWRQTLRVGDIAVRSGGDEFVLILPNTTADQAHALLGRLRSASSVPWSYGMTQWPTDEGYDLAVARADEELYQRKRDRGAY
ncbi:MAG: GGDEF domain-containing protein [Actinomycetota bacterium]|nr:GGDEF domain-containing protein [Actinomycetota bacterium]